MCKYPKDLQILTYKKVSHFLTPSKFHKSWIEFVMTHLRIDICQYLSESKNAILVGQLKIFHKRFAPPLLHCHPNPPPQLDGFSKWKKLPNGEY